MDALKDNGCINTHLQYNGHVGTLSIMYVIKVKC